MAWQFLPETIDLLQVHRRYPARLPFFLESRAVHPGTGRYDLLLGLPEDSLTLRWDGTIAAEGDAPGEPGDFLQALDVWYQRERAGISQAPPPFAGGWFLYLGYELAAQIEPVLSLPRTTRVPIAYAVRCRGALIRDHVDGRLWAAAESEAALAELCRLADDGPAPAPVPERLVREVIEEPAERYLSAVRRTQRYIRDGDIFQANLSRAWRGRLASAVTPADLYERLRAANPSPFGGLARLPFGTIVSTSPERLLSIRAGIAETRPIAGTRPRSLNVERDRANSTELLMHPKERAEHVMLLDLERNDLGRISATGSVQVSERMVLESYAHVHHIVSNVTARLRPEITPGSAIRAVFPGGTITGCPKVRCMQIIAEMERQRRGMYTGSMGYLALNGDLDLNILIRSVWVQAQDFVFRTGGGIVMDSDPEAELMETRHKALGLLRGLGQGESAGWLSIGNG